MSFFPFLLFLFSLLPPLFRTLFTVSLLFLFSCFALLYALFRSVYYLPTLITFSCPSFLSSTLFSFLPLYYYSVRPSYVSFSFDCFINFVCIF
jgi:hypothetical protein